MLALRLIRRIENEHGCIGDLEVVDARGQHVSTLYTIERPWLPHEEGKGGTPFRSCIAPGSYALTPYTRPSGERAWVLSNPQLDVYKLDSDIPPARRNKARCLILIHAGNYVRDVVGCIAPGTGWRTQRDGTMMVTNSRLAIRRLHEMLDGRRRLEMDVFSMTALV